jgi:hypothetical protein
MLACTMYIQRDPAHFRHLPLIRKMYLSLEQVFVSNPRGDTVIKKIRTSHFIHLLMKGTVAYMLSNLRSCLYIYTPFLYTKLLRQIMLGILFCFWTDETCGRRKPKYEWYSEIHAWEALRTLLWSRAKYASQTSLGLTVNDLHLERFGY